MKWGRGFVGLFAWFLNSVERPADVLVVMYMQGGIGGVMRAIGTILLVLPTLVAGAEPIDDLVATGDDAVAAALAACIMVVEERPDADPGQLVRDLRTAGIERLGGVKSLGWEDELPGIPIRESKQQGYVFDVLVPYARPEAGEIALDRPVLGIDGANVGVLAYAVGPGIVNCLLPLLP